MVTTFVIHQNIYQSAKMLAKMHVHNQCREDIMAINYLLKLDYVCQLLQLQPCPAIPAISDDIIADFLAKVAWARGIVTQYKDFAKEKQQELGYSKNNNSYQWFPYGRKDLLPEDYKFLFKGYVNHPATLAWAGHTQALMKHCNIHNQVALERDFKSEIVPYDLPEEVQWPWWVSNPIIIGSYRNNLLMKELVRGYDPWYTKDEEIVKIVEEPIYGCGNLWLVNLSYETLQLIYKEQWSQLNFWEICDVPNYGVSGKTTTNKISLPEKMPKKDCLQGKYLYHLATHLEMPNFYKMWAAFHLQNLNNQGPLQITISI